jgi:hypothetical protein
MSYARRNLDGGLPGSAPPLPAASGSLVGDDLTRRYGAALVGRFTDEVDLHPPVDKLTDQRRATVERRAPTYFQHLAPDDGTFPPRPAVMGWPTYRTADRSRLLLLKGNIPPFSRPHRPPRWGPMPLGGRPAAASSAKLISATAICETSLHRAAPRLDGEARTSYRTDVMESAASTRALTLNQ